MGFRSSFLIGSLVLSACSSGSTKSANASNVWTNEAACQTDKLAAEGGALPENPDVFALRYMGSANLELAYRDTVILFDAHFSRTPPARILPASPERMNRVDAIYIGHGHGDHMADAPRIAQQTNAPMYGAWPTTEAAEMMGLDQNLNRTVENGDVQQYPGFRVEAILAHHSQVTDGQGNINQTFANGRKAWQQLQQATGLASPEMPNAPQTIQGSSSPRVIDEGTIGYLVTFNDGYTLYIQDSSGPITDYQHSVLQRLGGKVDMAIISYQGFWVPERQIEQTLPIVEFLKPDVFVPYHHDQTGGSFPDLATYPLFMAINEKLPATRSISPTYGTPICVNTKLKGGQGVFVGESWTWPENADP